MANRVAFFVSLLALALAGLIASAPPGSGAEGSGTFVVISDLHFNPFDPPALATALTASMLSKPTKLKSTSRAEKSLAAGE